MANCRLDHGLLFGPRLVGRTAGRGPAVAPAPQVVDLAITPLETDSPVAQLQTSAVLPPSEPSEHGIVGKDIAWAHILQPALQGGAVSDDRLSILQDEDTILKLVSEEKRQEKRLERRAGGGRF